MITPQQIALGGGDDYLLQLNAFFAKRGLPAYIRPLGEPNRCLNAWSAVNCDGTQKGGEHTTGWYKQAFRRIAAIVRGGQTLEGINATLAEIGLPPLNRTKGPNPPSLPAAPVSIIWSPLPGGSPRVKGNFPGNYWPAAAGSTGSAPTSTPSIRSGKTSTASTAASSGRASRSRSPSGRSPATTNRASSSS